jgi:hypothetical protein
MVNGGPWWRQRGNTLMRVESWLVWSGLEGNAGFYEAMLRGLVILAVLAVALWPRGGEAQQIKNQIAVFAALDKVTARISPLEIPVNKSKTFGALTITPRACNSRPPTEEPLTSAFVEIEETQLDNTHKRIFTGWMFAQSPGLHGVEHPVFDVWLTSCKTLDAGKPGGSSWKPE